MRDWLLKEEKAKVGRPRLAADDAVKKAKLLITICLMICTIMAFSFISIIKGISPAQYAYRLTFEKLLGTTENPDGFITKDYYDDDYNYVMEIKVPKEVSKYSGYYKYTTYYLKDNGWVKKESNKYPNDTKSFKIKIDSLKNKNVTWKIELQVLNASVINKSYAPSSWTFVDAKKQEDKLAYKVFTVKGYYSPVTTEEINEAGKSPNKVAVETTRENPRGFILLLPEGTYDVMVKYTDASGKEVLLSKDKGIEKRKVYEVPNLNRSTKVSFKVWPKTGNIKGLGLSNWKVFKDKHNDEYLTNSYVLKPAKSYEN